MAHLCLYPLPLAWQLFLAHFRDMEFQVIRVSWERNFLSLSFLFPSPICAHVLSLTFTLSMLLEKLMTTVAGFFRPTSVTILDSGHWLIYWDLWQIISKSRGPQWPSASNKGHLLAWHRLGPGSVDIGEPLAWGRIWSWARERGRMSIELARIYVEYMLVGKKGVSGESENRIESIAGQNHPVPYLLRVSQERSWLGAREYCPAEQTLQLRGVAR